MRLRLLLRLRGPAYVIFCSGGAFFRVPGNDEVRESEMGRSV
jgi:hypothetical protein